MVARFLSLATMAVGAFSASDGRHLVIDKTNQTIADVIANDQGLASFQSLLLLTAGLINDTSILLDDLTANLTVFAPPVDDIIRISGKFLNDSSWILHLHDIINLHVYTQGSILSDKLTVNNNTNILEMRNGEEVQVVKTATGAITLNSSNTAQALVLETDIFCANGVIHKVDKFLLPVWYDRDTLPISFLVGNTMGRH